MNIGALFAIAMPQPSTGAKTTDLGFASHLEAAGNTDLFVPCGNLLLSTLGASPEQPATLPFFKAGVQEEPIQFTDEMIAAILGNLQLPSDVPVVAPVPFEFELMSVAPKAYCIETTAAPDVALAMPAPFAVPPIDPATDPPPPWVMADLPEAMSAPPRTEADPTASKEFAIQEPNALSPKMDLAGLARTDSSSISHDAPIATPSFVAPSQPNLIQVVRIESLPIQELEAPGVNETLRQLLVAPPHFIKAVRIESPGAQADVEAMPVPTRPMNAAVVELQDEMTAPTAQVKDSTLADSAKTKQKVPQAAPSTPAASPTEIPVAEGSPMVENQATARVAYPEVRIARPTANEVPVVAAISSEMPGPKVVVAPAVPLRVAKTSSETIEIQAPAIGEGEVSAQPAIREARPTQEAKHERLQTVPRDERTTSESRPTMAEVEVLPAVAPAPEVRAAAPSGLSLLRTAPEEVSVAAIDDMLPESAAPLNREGTEPEVVTTVARPAKLDRSTDALAPGLGNPDVTHVPQTSLSKVRPKASEVIMGGVVENTTDAPLPAAVPKSPDTKVVQTAEFSRDDLVSEDHVALATASESLEIAAPASPRTMVTTPPQVDRVDLKAEVSSPESLLPTETKTTPVLSQASVGSEVGVALDEESFADSESDLVISPTGTGDGVDRAETDLTTPRHELRFDSPRARPVATPEVSLREPSKNSVPDTSRRLAVVRDHMDAIAVARASEAVTMVIEPKDLGEIRITLTQRDGSVEARATTQDERVREVLASGHQDLSRQFEHRGLRLERFAVESGGADARSSGHSESQPRSHQGPQTAPRPPAEAPARSQPPRLTFRRLPVGALDIAI